MEIKLYDNEYFNGVFHIVHKTIEEIYPKYYPRMAVDFFHKHHSKENMEKQLPSAYTLVLFENKELIGSGTLYNNEIKRFFILPQYQNKGYGKKFLGRIHTNYAHAFGQNKSKC
jgi:GNAT superfamily N-acetyltransferase